MKKIGEIVSMVLMILALGVLVISALMIVTLLILPTYLKTKDVDKTLREMEELFEMLIDKRS